MSEVGSPEMEGVRRKAKVISLKTEVRRRKTEVRITETEVGSHDTDEKKWLAKAKTGKPGAIDSHFLCLKNS